jgi:hypothetical protein
MKKTFLLSVLLILFIGFSFYNVSAQVPEGLNYQAVTRDASGALVKNQAIGVRLSIISGSPTGVVQWQEKHSVNTNNLGLFTLVIGQGTSTGVGASTTFAAINWASASYYLKVETDYSGGTNYTDMGTTQFWSVPYAFVAQNAFNSHPGPTGPTGPIGPMGPSGSNGTNGLNGATGPTGHMGPTGVIGPLGPVGTAGTTGHDGPTGSMGPQGITGSFGATGANGATGTAGTNGATGTAGANGANGATGNNGAIGATGAAGNNGAIGATGAAGANGTNGANGATGNNGAIGATGAAGTNGTNGTNGATGAAGTNGTNGINGATGAAGTNGTNGINGATGAAGSNGTNGIDGDTGDTGPAGSIGKTGAAGPAGATGANGINGTNGTDGVTGDIGPTGFGMGPTGPTGAAGTNGTNGSTGALGSNGIDGATGDTGPAGVIGKTGAQGPAGPTGAAGSNGTNGTNGTNGSNGAAGATGPTGSNGTNGTNGTNGSNGSNGAAGATGPTGSNGTNGTNGTNGSNGSNGAAGATGPTGPGTICGGATTNYVTKFTGPTTMCNSIIQDNGTTVGVNSAPFAAEELYIKNSVTGDGLYSTGNGLGNGATLTASGNFDGVDAFSTGAQPYNNAIWADQSGATANGTTFGNANANIAVDGELTSNKTYSLATYGLFLCADAGRPTRSSGLYGCYGDQFSPYTSLAEGAVAYRCGANGGGGVAGNYYSFYGMGFGGSINGTGGGRLANPGILATDSSAIVPTAQIGMGLNGGIMGGWVNSPLYGMYIKGNRYGLYTDGQSYANNLVVQLGTSKSSPDKLIPTYTPTSTTVDIITRGTGKLINGKATIRFDENFANSLSDKFPVNITIAPLGNSNGVYVSGTSATGFNVSENNSGQSNVEFNWVAIGVKQGYESPQIPQEILAKSYNQNMNQVMIPDNSTDVSKSSIPVWWDGKNIRFDAIPEGITFPGAQYQAKKHSGLGTGQINPNINNGSISH